MQKKTRIALTLGAVSLLAVGGVAGIANADRGGGGWGRGGGHGMMANFAERYDANKDGKVSQEEIDQNRTSWHGEFDGDKNGTLSLEEFKGLWMKAYMERMVREFQSFDKDGNAQITLDEYKAPLSDVVSERDRNNDGVLSKDDRPAGHGKRQHRMRGEGMGQGMGQGMGPGADDGDDAQ